LFRAPEKTHDVDIRREMFGFAAERLMEMEVGASYRRHLWREACRSPAQGNGYRDRDWEARACTVELR
jgi:putative transposase